MTGEWKIAFYCSAVLFLFSVLGLCVTKFCFPDLVQDIETGRIPPTITPTRIHVFHHLVVGLGQANSDPQALAELNAHHGEIVQEQIYDGSTYKNDNCVICLEEFEKNQKIRFLVACQHSFHGHCLRKWLLVNPSCPLCREPIKF